MSDLISLLPYERDRAGWFMDLGFEADQALALATARDSARQYVTVHDVRKALGRGLDHAAAMNIFV